MSKKKQPPSKEELEALYSNENKSPNELAKFYGVARPCLLRWLKEYDIKIRNHTDASKIVATNQIGKQRKGYEDVHKILDNHDWLYEQRSILKKSIRRIAKELNVSYTLVKDYLIKYGFERGERVDSVSQSLKNNLTEENIKKKYEEGLTIREVAKFYNVSCGQVWPLFKKYEIEARDPNSYDKPFCHISKVHQEIIDFLKENYDGEIEINNRSILSNNSDIKELDIYIPEKKFAIEYNGLYWHSEERGKNRWYHLSKTKECEKKNVFLLHIFGDTWEYKKDIIKSMILNKLGLTIKKYYARKTIIKEVNYIERREFFKENHIQGEDNATFGYGLYYDNKIVACISFSKARFNKKYQWELVRYANIKNTIVVGGFSKLLKYFRSIKSGSIISYSDRSYASGNVYSKNGFKLEFYNYPSYYYLDKNYTVRYHRSAFTKERIKNKFEDVDINKSEQVIMKELGYKRIWDCGTIRWVLQ